MLTQVKGAAVSDSQPQSAPVTTVSRRDALKRGALTGGTLLWLTPTVSSVLLRASAAEATSPKPGGGGGHLAPLPHPPTGLPSHGCFVLRDASGLYAYQITASGTGVALSAPGLGNDIRWLQTHGYAGQKFIRSGPVWTKKKSLVKVGQIRYPGTAVTVLCLSAWPNVLQGAWTWDGSFQKDADHDMMRAAVLTAGKYYFFK